MTRTKLVPTDGLATGIDEKPTPDATAQSTSSPPEQLDHPAAHDLLAHALAVPTWQLSEIGSWHAHVPFAYALVAAHRPTLTVELGVHKGDSYLTFCCGIADHGVPGRAIAVDTWQGDEHAGQYNGDAILADLKTRHDPRFAAFSTLARMTFDQALDLVEDGTVDLLHIDGLHTYEAVRHDFESWRPKLSSRAVVLFHDTQERRDDFGVWRFWEEVNSLGPSYDFPYGHGLGVLALGPEVPPATLALLDLLNSGGKLAGLPAAELLGRIGRGLADERRAAFLKSEVERVEHAWLDERARAGAELTRLNTEIAIQGGRIQSLEAERAVLQDRIDELKYAGPLPNALPDKAIMELLARSGEALTEARKYIVQEMTKVNSPLADQTGKTGVIDTERTLPIAAAPEPNSASGAIQYAPSTHHDSFRSEKTPGSRMANRASESATVIPSTLSKGAFSHAKLPVAATAAYVKDQSVEALKSEHALLQRALTELDTKFGLIELSIANLKKSVTERGVALGQLNHPLQMRLMNTLPRLSRAPVLQHIRSVPRRLGRVAIDSLPIAADRKVRIKRQLLNLLGRLGAEPGATVSVPQVTVSRVSVPTIDERYIELAAVACGRPRSMPERSVSIVIPVYNQLELTLKCLDSIAHHTGHLDVEIIVVDDGSTDATQATLAARTDIVYLRNPHNLGFIGSCNRGAAQARKTYLCFLNNDTEVVPGWLTALVNTFELHENVGLAGSKLIYPDGRLQEAGGLIWQDGTGWNWGRGKSIDDPAYDYARKTDYCSGAAILVPRVLFQSLGGFDVHYAPAYGEDSDLAFKIRALGLSTLYQPLSRVVHHEGATSGTDVTQGTKRHQVVNAQKLAERWRSVLQHHGLSEQAHRLSDRGTLGRTLVLDQITPEPDHDAGSITALEIMRALRDLGYKITFVPCSNLAYVPPYTHLLSALGIESILYPWHRSVEDYLVSHGHEFDAIVLFRPKTWHDLIASIRRYAPQAKLIYHSSDLHHLRAERERRLRETAALSHTNGKHPIDERSGELDIIRNADLSIVHSTFEQKLLAELLPDSKVVCFPWIFEPRGKGPPFASRSGVMFLGGYGHPPNVDAVEYYVRDIHPLLKQKLPTGVTFTAAGSSPPASLKAMQSDDILVPGFVPDIEPVLNSARIMVVPLRYGAGIKGKIVTAMAYGLPIVTTSVGAEGMELVDGEHVLIADTPEAFAEQVARLYGDEALWHRLQAAALDYVHRTTSRAAGLRIIASILDSLGLPRLFPSNIYAATTNAAPQGFGSRPELSDPARLIEAAARQLPAGGTPDLVVLPDGLSLESAGCRAMHLTAFLEEPPNNLAHLVIVADASDPAALDSLDGALIRCAPAATVIAFAPPRLTVEDGRFHVRAPFDDREIEQIGAPIMEQVRSRWLFATFRQSWSSDIHLTGYPSLMLLSLTPSGPVP